MVLSKRVNCLILVLIIVGLGLFYQLRTRTIGPVETFMPGPCPNCGKRNRFQCSDCRSCGWCVTPDGLGECVPGDQNGPFFRQDCVSWEYNPAPQQPFRGWRPTLQDTYSYHMRRLPYRPHRRPYRHYRHPYPHPRFSPY